MNIKIKGKNYRVKPLKERKGLLILISLMLVIGGFEFYESYVVSNATETVSANNKEVEEIQEQLASKKAQEQISNHEVKAEEPKEEKTADIKESYNVPLDSNLQDYIISESRKYCIEPRLVFAIIKTESDFKADTVSETNDYGLMQINGIHKEQLASKLGITNLMDPYQNAKAGIHILSKCLADAPSIEIALMAYNMGQGGAKRALNNGVTSTEYTRKVLEVEKEIVRGGM